MEPTQASHPVVQNQEPDTHEMLLQGSNKIWPEMNIIAVCFRVSVECCPSLMDASPKENWICIDAALNRCAGPTVQISKLISGYCDDKAAARGFHGSPAEYGTDSEGSWSGGRRRLGLHNWDSITAPIAEVDFDGSPFKPNPSDIVQVLFCCSFS